MKSAFFILFLLSMIPQQGKAQLFDDSYQIKYDTNYITTYRDEFTTRLYLSRKQNGYNLSERLLNP